VSTLAPDCVFSVPSGRDRERLGPLLLERYPHLTRIFLRKRIAAGLVLVNGQPRDSGFRLSAGDRVEVGFDTRVATAMQPEPMPLCIRFEDEDLLVLDKPPGVLVHPVKHEKHGTLANGLAWYLNRGAGAPAVRPFFVHRLDRATSGLLLVAKSATAMAALSRQFEQRTVEKRYRAWAAGRIEREAFSIEMPIGRDADRRPQWNVDLHGKPAVSQVRVLERRSVETVLELEPLSGRTNQLRIHLAWAGHPIVGDDWYGGPPADRLYLHAARLVFDHPRTGTRLALASEAGF
jgi:23S rRNA pseudouridine1911/1915/1917 synthase